MSSSHRYRVRYVQTRGEDLDGNVFFDRQQIQEYMADHLSTRSPSGFYESQNNCEHIKMKPTSGRFQPFGFPEGIYTDWVDHGYVPSVSDISSLFSSSDFKLDFQQDNGFEIINFALEIDGVIALFSRKFWRDLSYGSVNWGLLPLVSEVKSLYNTLLSYYGGGIYDTLRKVATQGQRISVSRQMNLYEFTGKARATFVVKQDFPDLESPFGDDSILILYDELGFHPDLRTVWDLLPLSFVVDYVLPVGDWLESLHPRGWYKPFTQDGDIIVSCRGNSPREYADGTIADADIYVRGSTSLSSLPEVRPPEWQMPSPREFFNSAYIGLLKKYKGRAPRKIRRNL